MRNQVKNGSNNSKEEKNKQNNGEIKNLSEDMYGRTHDESSFNRLINEQNKIKEQIDKKK